MNEEHARASLLTFLDTVMPAVNAAPTHTRADCYDGIFIACRETAPDLAQAAREAAATIRDADHRQLYFRQLLPSESA